MTILGHQHQSFDLSLSDQKPVKRIGMMKWQRSGPVGMARRDVDGIETGPGQNL